VEKGNATREVWGVTQVGCELRRGALDGMKPVETDPGVVSTCRGVSTFSSVRRTRVASKTWPEKH